MKFGTAHGRSRPEVSSAKYIDFYGRGEVSQPSLEIGTSDQQIIAPIDLLMPEPNFYSLTV